LFVDEFGYEKKVIFAQVIIQRILETLEAFMKPRSLFKPGQLLWMAVANDGKKHAGQQMKDIPQVPVVLDLITREDLQALADGQKYIDVRRQRNARLLEQAFTQGGVLSQSDLASMVLVSNKSVGEDIRYFQKKEDRLLPYRGTIHDLGRALTHKVEIIRLFEQGYLESDICNKLSPAHDLSSVERYVQRYKNILKLLMRGFSPLEISGILSISKSLVVAYVEIASEHHPDLVGYNPPLPLEEKGSSQHP
jgi:DNA-binding NarL/FixJ family response regulator